MAIGILGNKIGMTQIFDAAGEIIPVTIIKGGPCYVTQIKSNENCGYNSVQLGYLEVAPNLKSLTKPKLGHFSKKNLPPYRYLKEYKTDEIQELSLGQKFGVDLFEVVESLNVTGFTIGKGNTSNFKLHNHSTGLMSHGGKSKRLQGSMGPGTTPGRVYPGKRMAGRLGAKNTTVKGLKILKVDSKENILVVKGNVPGKPGNLLNIKPSKY